MASLGVAGCGRSQPDETAPPADQPPAVTATPAPEAAPEGGPATAQPAVLPDGRHPNFVNSLTRAGGRSAST